MGFLMQYFCRLAAVTSISVETVRFDRQKIGETEITGLAYQQRALFGDDMREYLFENRDLGAVNL